MLKTFVKRIFDRPNAGTAVPVVESISFSPPTSAGRVVQYPPQDPGFVCMDGVQLLGAQSDIIAMLKLHAASTPALYLERYEQPILNLSEYISNLPGTSSGVFAGEGGLMRACVEMAFNSFRASDGRIFTGASGVEERHLLEGRWRYVCFVAGLLYPVGASIQAMQVINSDGRRWSAELDSLQAWAGVGHRYWVTWAQEDMEPGPASIMGMLLNRIVGRKNVDWLNEGSPDLIKRLVEIVTGSTAAASLNATNVVQSVWSSVHEREVARRHQNYGRLVVGSHISPYIIDAMVNLTKQVWCINERTVFADASGVHIEWPKAGTDIIEYCKQHGYPGIPSSEGALLTMLCANKIVVGGVDGVAITEIANAEGEIVTAVKLTKSGLLVDDPSIFAKQSSRPVAMAAVLAADPLTAPSPEKQARKSPAKKAVSPPVPVDSPTLDTLDLDDNSDEGENGRDVGCAAPVSIPTPNREDVQTGPVVQELTLPALKPQKTEDAGVTGAKVPPTNEGAEVKYASLVDKDIVAKLKPHATEILGKVIHAWREKTDPQYVMRTTSIGAAVEKDFLLLCSSRGPDAILEWAAAGLLYIDPMRPGVKVHQIAIVDGGQKTVDCVVFSRGTVKLLGMI